MRRARRPRRGGSLPRPLRCARCGAARRAARCNMLAGEFLACNSGGVLRDLSKPIRLPSQTSPNLSAAAAAACRS